jgi:hypothetical protein
MKQTLRVVSNVDSSEVSDKNEVGMMYVIVKTSIVKPVPAMLDH